MLCSGFKKKKKKIRFRPISISSDENGQFQINSGWKTSDKFWITSDTSFKQQFEASFINLRQIWTIAEKFEKL